MTFSKYEWFAYIIDLIVDNCKRECKKQCKGCQLQWKSSFLHQHDQLSILGKVEKHLDSARGHLLCMNLEYLFHEFLCTQNEAISTSKEKELLDQTRCIIIYATPQSMYRFISRGNMAKRISNPKKRKSSETQPIDSKSPDVVKKRRERRQPLECSPSKIANPHLQNAAKDIVTQASKKLIEKSAPDEDDQPPRKRRKRQRN